MFPKNALTDRLGLAYPIIQAPMASATTPALAASVSEAGGLGSLGWARPRRTWRRRKSGASGR